MNFKPELFGVAWIIGSVIISIAVFGVWFAYHLITDPEMQIVMGIAVAGVVVPAGVGYAVMKVGESA